MSDFQYLPLPELVQMLIAKADERGDHPQYLLACGVVHACYSGCLILSSEEVPRFEAAIRSRPLPIELRTFLGAAFEQAMGAVAVDHWLSRHPFLVLQRFVRDHGSALIKPLTTSLLAALDERLIAYVDNRPYLLATSVEHTRFGQRDLPQHARHAIDSFWAAQKAADEANYRARVRTSERFVEQCFHLESALKEYDPARPGTLAEIERAGDRCLAGLPFAKGQAARAAVEQDRYVREDLGEEPVDKYFDRYATQENVALPKYARFLSKLGRYQDAAHVCEAAIRYGIEPQSPGAFERSLAAARKKLDRKPPVSRPRAPRFLVEGDPAHFPAVQSGTLLRQASTLPAMSSPQGSDSSPGCETAAASNEAPVREVASLFRPKQR